MSKRTFIASVFISAVFLFQATAQADTDLKWANSVGEIIKPIKVEVDNSNADVGGVFVYVTYQMVRCSGLQSKTHKPAISAFVDRI